jgi:hypothetical protein
MTMRQTMPFEENIHPFSKICRAVPKNYLERKVWDPDVKKTVDIPLSHFYHTRCHYDQGYDCRASVETMATHVQSVERLIEDVQKSGKAFAEMKVAKVATNLGWKNKDGQAPANMDDVKKIITDAQPTTQNLQDLHSILFQMWNGGGVMQEWLANYVTEAAYTIVEDPTSKSTKNSFVRVAYIGKQNVVRSLQDHVTRSWRLKILNRRPKKKDSGRVEAHASNFFVQYLPGKGVGRLENDTSLQAKIKSKEIELAMLRKELDAAKTNVADDDNDIKAGGKTSMDDVRDVNASFKIAAENAGMAVDDMIGVHGGEKAGTGDVTSHSAMLEAGGAVHPSGLLIPGCERMLEVQPSRGDDNGQEEDGMPDDVTAGDDLTGWFREDAVGDQSTIEDDWLTSEGTFLQKPSPSKEESILTFAVNVANSNKFGSKEDFTKFMEVEYADRREDLYKMARATCRGRDRATYNWLGSGKLLVAVDGTPRVNY